MTSSHDPSDDETGGAGVEHRKVQREQDAKDRAAQPKVKNDKPVQAGHRPEPENPMPAQHLKKPGIEADMDLQPRFKEVEDEVAKLYAQHFSEQEMKQILAFYQSPVGKKVLHEQPKVVDGSMKYAQDWANKLSEEVTAKMRDELKKRGHPM